MKRLMKASVLVVAGVTIACLAMRTAHTQSVSCLVTTIAGDVQGMVRGASCAFLGIPYAAAPVGSLRWKPPQPASPWTVLNAVTPPPTCPSIQLPAGALVGNEDCLKLNIWVADPPPRHPAPVIVWLHTGAFYAASANFPSHNGERLARETGAIIVAPNYRLGPFGFLAHTALAAEDPAYHSSGNYGLLDQRAALAWVRANIDRFGGDPWNVTLAGTSAGADSVGLHLISPRSGSFFQRAIIESGSPTVQGMTHTEATAQGDAFSAALGCAHPGQVLECMRSKTRDQVLVALSQENWQAAEPAGKVFWHPVIDGIEIPDQPRFLFETGLFNQVPIIIGTNRDEGVSFVTRSFPGGVSVAQYDAWAAHEFGPYSPMVLTRYPAADFDSPMDAMAEVIGDGQFVCEARRLARSIAETRTPTFVYSYEHEIDDVFPDRVIHGVESNIIFGNDYVAPQFPGHILDGTDLSLHAAMAGYWTHFAATGNPNAPRDGVIRWPQFKDPKGPRPGPDKFIVFGTPVRPDKRPREQRCNFWEPFFFRTMLGGLPASAP